ncbi:hypothetical protein [Dactylosporangium sp. NPDC050588]|uniref:hypothetical protein n=1 Tax=Dactylosporangium sp. NPDC050588 TaxID=3157211 RepID=UPI0033DD91BB
MTDARDRLVTAAKRYRRTEAAHEEARREVQEALVAALEAGVGPTEVQRLSGLTGAYIRKLARERGVPPAPPGPKSSARVHGDQSTA